MFDDDSFIRGRYKYSLIIKIYIKKIKKWEALLVVDNGKLRCIEITSWKDKLLVSQNKALRPIEGKEEKMVLISQKVMLSGTH